MKFIFVDYETYYSKEYSLRLMTPVEYILDSRFEAIGCAIKEGIEAAPYWVEGPDLPRWFAQCDSNAAMGSHNWAFDGSITAWRYGYNPRLMFCTLSMARACLKHLLRSVSLASVGKLFGWIKGDTVHNVIGMSYAALLAQPQLYKDYQTYSLNDVDMCAAIFRMLAVSEEGRQAPFPMNELRVLDMVLRMTIEPEFILDQNLLCEHLAQVQADKELLLAQSMLLGADGEKSLRSDEQFAALLRNMGVEPPTKISPTTGQTKYAFAKTDAEFLALAEHDNPGVQTLVEARLGHKSTIEESRTQRYISISNLQWPARVTYEGNQAPVSPEATCKHLMPMPVSFSAAHTHRLGGDWKLNVQNLTRRGKLRRALTAPEGHDVLTVDASQIEAREVAYFSGQQDLTSQFGNGEDVYASFASVVFGFPVDKRSNPTERFVGKQGILGLGYGLGWPKFQARLKTDSKNQTGSMIELSEQEAARIVGLYRSKYYCIPAAWRRLNYEGIPALAHGGTFEFGPCKFEQNAILLPNGMRLHYHDLENKDGEWLYRHGGNVHRLYGGALMENIMQALARIHTLEAALRIQDRCKREFGVVYRLKQQAHDENVFLPRKEHTPVLRLICLEEMRRRPWWAPTLPLDAEVGIGPTYGDAK